MNKFVPSGLRQLQLPRELALDLIQLCLDLGGVFEPTPTCDAINTVVSLARGNVADAAINAVSIVPYVGDAAKFTRIQKKIKLIRDLGDFAKHSPSLARPLASIVRFMQQSVERIPTKGNADIKELKQTIGKLLAQLHSPTSLGNRFHSVLATALEHVDRSTRLKILKEHHAWGKLFPHPDWPKVKSVIEYVMREGVPQRWKQHGHSKVVQYKGFQVRVIYRDHGDRLTINDAWVTTSKNKLTGANN